MKRRLLLFGLLLVCCSCTTITTLEVGGCDFYIAKGEPVVVTFELVEACQALGEPIRFFKVMEGD